MLLTPKLGLSAPQIAEVYSWGEKNFAQEQIVLHPSDRWLPNKNTTWDDLLAAAVDKGLDTAGAPQSPEALSQWVYGKDHFVDIEHPVFSLSPLIESILSVPVGTGPQPQSGDTVTVKQVARTFGPSERFTADLSDLDHSTLNLVLGQSGNPVSPWFQDQFPAWYHNTTYPLPFSSTAIQSAATHTLTLTPQ